MRTHILILQNNRPFYELLNVMRSFFSFRFCFTFIFTLSVSILSFAQEIEEVEITAERQENSTLELTSSVDVFDLEDLETYQISGLADISNNVPGLTASPSGSQGLRFTLRGVGARDNQLGVESKIGLYVDGAFMGRASGLVFDIVDLESVSVLKGPQGFSYGRNAIGGAINLITAKADVEAFSAKLDLTVGNFERKNATVRVNVPLSDNFAIRASGFVNQREGWVENTGLGEDWGGFQREGFRVATRWYASESVTVDYSYDKADFETQPVYYQPQFIDGETSFDPADYINLPGSLATTDGVFLSPIGPKRLDRDRSTTEIENSTTVADGHSLVVNWEWSDAHSMEFIATHRTTDVIDTFYFFPNIDTEGTFQQAFIDRFGARLRPFTLFDEYVAGNTDSVHPGFTPTGALELARLAGGEDDLEFARQLQAAIDDGGGFLPIAQVFANNPGSNERYGITFQFDTVFSSPPGGSYTLRDHKQFSFELRQKGSFLDDRLTYTSGLYYFNERTGNGRVLPQNERYFDYIEILDFGQPVPGEAAVENFGFSFTSINKLNTDSTGVYATIDYIPLSFDERMKLTFGLRYSRDERSLFRQGLNAFTLQPRGGTDDESARWEHWDPMMVIAYDLTEEIKGYFSIASGFRGGNYNVLSRDLPSQGGEVLQAALEFDEETLISYEAGAKGTVLDGIAEFEFALFYYDISDGQETVIQPTSPISRSIVNVDGYAFGIEMDTTISITEELSTKIVYTHLRSGTDSYQNPFIEQFEAPLDDGDIGQLLGFCAGGLRVPDVETGQCLERKSNFGAPVNSWQVGLNYRLPTDFGEVFSHLGYSFKDAHFVNDTLQVDARNLWDARLQFTFEGNTVNTKVALWAQNLFDNEYQVQKFELNGVALDIASYGDPRMIGIDIGFEWF